MTFGNTDNIGFQLAVGVLRTVSFLYDLLTLPLYLIIQNPAKNQKLARKKRAEVVSRDDTSITYRSLQKPTHFHLEIERENLETMADVLEYSKKNYGERRCLGTRELLSEDEEVLPDGRVFEKYDLGDYKWQTFAEVNRLASNFGKGLRELGVPEKSKVVIFAETRAEYLIAANGLFKQSCTMVTVYATLGEDGIAHAINETGVTTVVTSLELLPKLTKVLLSTPKVDKVIYMEEQIKILENPEDFPEGIKLDTFERVLQIGAQSSFADNFPTKEDTAIIMYTSGSTGAPKGAVILHENLIATFKGFCDSTDIYTTDVMLGFLPLAHVYELLVEHTVLFMGARIGYSSALTLLDSSSKIKKGGKGDVTVLRPTFLTSVPLVVGRIAKGVQDKISKANFLTRVLFNFAYQYKIWWSKFGFGTPLLDRLIFSAVAKIIGGKARMIVVGGSPLTAEIQTLIRTCFCLKLIQGYGLTESTASATVQDIHDIRFGRVGAPMTGIDIKLENWDEGNYFIKDQPNPRGEIILGGDNICHGYYELPEETHQSFYKQDGKRWFRTGDIGEMHKDGVLKIIDRKKDLVKLEMGEYLALGKLETELKLCPLIDNICIIADSTRPYCVAMIVPDTGVLQALAKQNGIKDKTFEELCSDQSVVKLVSQELVKFAKKAKFTKWEIPQAVSLTSEAWTPDNGLVTTTFKLKRRIIEEHYKNAIKTMYSRNLY